jgi:hypothetical protein
LQFTWGFSGDLKSPTSDQVYFCLIPNRPQERQVQCFVRFIPGSAKGQVSDGRFQVRLVEAARNGSGADLGCGRTDLRVWPNFF